jgi:hypothetical protein
MSGVSVDGVECKVQMNVKQRVVKGKNGALDPSLVMSFSNVLEPILSKEGELSEQGQERNECVRVG